MIESGWYRNSATLRLLFTELALKTFRADEGRFPATLDELVPKYLRAVPQDPFQPTPTPLVYSREGDSFELYSVGPNGIDDGGKLTPIVDLRDGGDLFLDALREENVDATKSNETENPDQVTEPSLE